MIHVRVALLAPIGLHVPAEGTLALPIECLDEGAAWELPDIKVTRIPAAKPAKAPVRRGEGPDGALTMTFDESGAYGDSSGNRQPNGRSEAANAFLWLGVRPLGAEPAQEIKPPPPTPPLLSLAFLRKLASLLPDAGAVIPTEPSHPAHGQLLAAFRARMITKWVGPLAVGAWDAPRILLGHNLELMRLYGISDAVAFEVLRPTVPSLSDDELHAAITRAGAHGLLAPIARDAILNEYARKELAAKQLVERQEVANRRAAEIHEYDLQAENLCLIRRLGGMPQDTGLPWHGWHTRLTDEVNYFDTLGLPLTAGPLAPGVSLETSGVARLTKAQRAALPPIPDGAIDAIGLLREQACASNRTYAPEDFAAGSTLTVEGRHAAAKLRLHAFRLFHAAHRVSPVSDGARFIIRLIRQLPIAYFPLVSFDTAVAEIQLAKQDYADGMTRKEGVLIDESIPREMIKALATPALWGEGECVRPPTADEARLLRKELDPLAFEKTVRKALGERREVTSADIYEALRKADLADENLSPETKGRVAALLERLGLRSAEKGTKREGNRRKVWVRDAAAPTVDTSNAYGLALPDPQQHEVA